MIINVVISACITTIMIEDDEMIQKMAFEVDDRQA
mgnify:CR=1 FL=1